MLFSEIDATGGEVDGAVFHVRDAEVAGELLTYTGDVDTAVEMESVKDRLAAVGIKVV